MFWFFLFVLLFMLGSPFIFIVLCKISDSNVFHKMKKSEEDKYYDTSCRKK